MGLIVRHTASPKQIDFLYNLGYLGDASKLTPEEAGTLIDELLAEQKAEAAAEAEADHYHNQFIEYGDFRTNIF